MLLLSPARQRATSPAKQGASGKAADGLYKETVSEGQLQLRLAGSAWLPAKLNMAGAAGAPAAMWLHWRRPVHSPKRVQVGANPSSASGANVSRVCPQEGPSRSCRVMSV